MLSPSVAWPKVPDQTAMMVIPICTVAKQPRRIALQLERGFGAAVALGGQRLQPRRPRRNERDLGHRKKAVHQDQQQDDRQLQGQHGKPRWFRSFPRRRGTSGFIERGCNDVCGYQGPHGRA